MSRAYNIFSTLSVLIVFFFVSLPTEIPALGGEDNIVEFSVCYLFKTFRKLGGGKNNVRIKSERPRYAWAFDLSYIVGFRQVPLNVDEFIRPRFASKGCLRELRLQNNVHTH